jgi:hypothetical protein
VLIPEDNAKDLAEIPANVKEGLTIIPVSHVREVLAHALVRSPSPSNGTRPQKRPPAPRRRRRSTGPPASRRDSGLPSVSAVVISNSLAHALLPFPCDRRPLTGQVTDDPQLHRRQPASCAPHRTPMPLVARRSRAGLSSRQVTAYQFLAVPPLGKLRVVKANGPALTLKLRRAEGAKAAGLALAEDGEDS